VLTTFGDFDAAAVARFGAETMTPVEKSEITRSDKLSASGKNDWDPVAGPGLRVEPSSVHVNAWKSAEDGRGEILRLVETSGRSTGARIGAYRGVMSRVTRCSAVEDDLESVPVSDGGVRVTIPAFGLVTLRVEWEGR
jgi:alpha-mannosidase